MRSLAIDPGAIRLGWAVLETGPKYIASGILGLARPVLGIKKGKKIKEPFQEYKLRLEEYFAEAGVILLDTYAPDYLVNEILPAMSAGSFTGGSTDSELAKVALTCVHTLAYERGIPVHQIAANTVKTNIAGKKDATKVRVRNGVIQILPELKPRVKDWTKIFDEPDALAIGLAHMGVLNTN